MRRLVKNILLAPSMCEMLPLAKELAEETERHGPVSDNQEVQQKGLTVGRGMKMRTDFLNLFKPKPETAHHRSSSEGNTNPNDDDSDRIADTAY